MIDIILNTRNLNHYLPTIFLSHKNVFRKEMLSVKFIKMGQHLMSILDRFVQVYAGFCLDRFNCANKIKRSKYRYKLFKIRFQEK